MGKILSVLCILVALTGHGQQQQAVVTDDVRNFWKVYDQLLTVKDSQQRVDLIQTQYINKGTDGLRAIMQARRYSAAEYSKVINQYPLFWTSIRSNTEKVDVYALVIENAIEALRRLYRNLQPATVYFTVGAFRTGGTTLGNKVLIGSEVAMGDSNTITKEFGKNLNNLPPYFATNPVNSLGFLNVHEYIHTQQKTTIGNTLLAQTIIEGAAEFIATIALRTESPNAQIAYGRKNDARIKAAYSKEMFSPDFDNWLWNSSDNEFGMRDLGYYVGYAICEKYYRQSIDKKAAVKTMMTMDYNNEAQLIRFVESTHYFEKPLALYKQSFEKARPWIVRIAPFTNGRQDVDTGTKKVTLFFSAPMDKSRANFDIGPLGDKNTMWLAKRIGFSEDGRSYSFEIRPLEPGKRYQLWVTSYFTSSTGLPMRPYLIDIATMK